MSTADPNPGGAAAPRRAFVAMIVFIALTGLLFWLNPDNFYLWAKAIHVIAVISWMAGMLYLPRLFVYHAEVPVGSPQSELFKVMEGRLLRAIINPAMTVTWVFGLWLAWTGFSFSGGWLHAKVAAVLLMSGAHGYLSAAVRRFAEDRNEKSSRFWRAFNEVPTVLMIVIVVLVIVKPF